MIISINKTVSLAIRMSRYYFSNAHFYKDTVDNDKRQHRIDLRLRPEHQNSRTNIRDRQGKRSYIGKQEFLSGTMYKGDRKCVKCQEYRPLCEFENHAVKEVNRSLNGFNITCRTCQTTMYSHGYKVDHFIDDQDDIQEGTFEYDADHEKQPSSGYIINSRKRRFVLSDSSSEEESAEEEEFEEDDDSEEDEDFEEEENDSEEEEVEMTDIDLTEIEEEFTEMDLQSTEKEEDEFTEMDLQSTEDEEEEQLTPKQPSVHALNSRHLLFTSSDEEEEREDITTPRQQQPQHLLFDSSEEGDVALEEESVSEKSFQLEEEEEIPDLFIDGEPYYLVEQILQAMYSRPNKRWEYLIKWENFSEQHNSWEPAECLHPDLIEEYHQRHPRTSRKSL